MTQVEELPAPPASPVLDIATKTKDATAPGRPVLSNTITARQAYQDLLSSLGGPGKNNIFNGLSAYWSVGPVSYRRGSHGDLVPATVSNPVSVWEADSGFQVPPMDNADSQYRTLRQHALVPDFRTKVTDLPLPVLTGTFSQGKIAAFDPLSQVPLGPYQPTVAAPASQASRKALDGGDLLPDLNMGGLVTQPVQLITTLAALPTLENNDYTGGAQLARAPISVIRVRVAGVTGPDPASLNRIKTVAEQIELRTHLTVDIVAGSSPAPTTVALPAEQVRHARAAAHRGLGQEGRRGHDPERGRPQQRGAVRADPRGLRAVRGQLGHGGGPGPPGRSSGCWPPWAGPGPGCSPPCSARWR